MPEVQNVFCEYGDAYEIVRRHTDVVANVKLFSVLTSAA